MKKTHYFFTLGLIAILLALFFQYGVSSRNKTSTSASLEERLEHQRQSRAIDEYYDYLDMGDKYAKSQDVVSAEKMYLKALNLAKSPDGQTVARGVLADFYENIGEYQKALEQSEWFLKRNLTELGQNKYSRAKERLLKKMQETSSA